MKYIIIILCLVLSSCGMPHFSDDAYIEEIQVFDNHCHYKLNNGQKFSDSCGKFNIGDKVTTCKKN